MSLANYVPGGLGCDCGRPRGLGADVYVPSWVNSFATQSQDEEYTNAQREFAIAQASGDAKAIQDAQWKLSVLAAQRTGTNPVLSRTLSTSSIRAVDDSSPWRTVGNSGFVKNIVTGEEGTIAVGIVENFPSGSTVPERLVRKGGTASSPMSTTVPGGSGDTGSGFAEGLKSVLDIFGTATKTVAQDPIAGPVAMAQLQRLAPQGGRIDFSAPPQQAAASSGPGLGTALAVGAGVLVVGGVALGLASRKPKESA